MKPIFIQVASGQKMQFINLSAILYFESGADKTVNVYFAQDKSITIHMDMREFLEKIHRVL
jgi:DNA-binding LytR/AlgR family response regulator